jgi:CO dehydrogenase/acetyl-CoA synthase alpha subunit
MFTWVPPETNGEVIRVAIPVGELASKAARAISDARRRRTERKVDERIMQELQELAPGRKDEK